MAAYKSLVGLRRGRLLILEEGPPIVRAGSKYPERSWLCLCDCGNRLYRGSASLSVRYTNSSCGCQRPQNARPAERHGACAKYVVTPEYQAWRGMKTRCYNPKFRQFENYGGRGITVCDRWRNSFENFFVDMGERPTPKHSVDRINVNGNYEPSNCRWASKREQALNKRKSVRRPHWIVSAFSGIKFNADNDNGAHQNGQA